MGSQRRERGKKAEKKKVIIEHYFGEKACSWRIGDLLLKELELDKE